MSRGWLSLAMLTCGGAMLATTALAGPPMRQDGIFTVGNEGASVQIDPQVAYVSTAWWLEYATAAKLFNWPDRPGPLGNRLVPEAAASYAVSNRGRTYTFFIRPGFRFSDGTPVNAKSFATPSTGLRTTRSSPQERSSSPTRTGRTSSERRRSTMATRST